MILKLKLQEGHILAPLSRRYFFHLRPTELDYDAQYYLTCFQVEPLCFFSEDKKGNFERNYLPCATAARCKSASPPPEPPDPSTASGGAIAQKVSLDPLIPESSDKFMSGSRV